jgi:SAM-dependent methyltransferase
MIAEISLPIILAVLVLAFPVFLKNFDVIFIPTRRKHLRKIREELAIDNNDIIYDLGCGTGNILRFLLKDTSAQGVGIELSPLFYLFGKLINVGNPRINIKFGDALRINLDKTTIVYCFLLPKTMRRLGPILKNLKPTTTIVSAHFPIECLKPNRIVKMEGVEVAYIYKIK